MELHLNAPKNIDFSKNWGDYADKIIQDFEESVADGVWMGEPPDHEPITVCSYKGKPALITRNFHASECEMKLWDGNIFPQTLEVCSNLFIYPANYDPEEASYFEEWELIFEKILLGDGAYNIFSDNIPDDLMWTIDIMTGEDEHIVSLDGVHTHLKEFINKEIGIDNIVDQRVRNIVEDKISK